MRRTDHKQRQVRGALGQGGHLARAPEERFPPKGELDSAVPLHGGHWRVGQAQKVLGGHHGTEGRVTTNHKAKSVTAGKREF